jgi:hypothetical protein
MKIDSVVWKMKKAIEESEPTKSAKALRFVSVACKPDPVRTFDFVSVVRKPDPVRTVQFQIVHRVEIVQEQVGEGEVRS